MPELISPMAAPGPPSEGLEKGLLQADPAAFAAFFDFFLPRVYALAWRRSGDAARAERISEAVLAEAIRDLAERPPAEPLAEWIFRKAWKAAAAARDDASAA